MDIRYPVLQAIGIEGKDYVKILNEVGSPNATKAILEEMFRSGLTSSRPQANTNITLTHSGVVLLSKFQRDEEEQTNSRAAQYIAKEVERINDAKQRKKDRRNTLVIAVVTAIVGNLMNLLIQHFGQLTDIIFSLFH